VRVGSLVMVFSVGEPSPRERRRPSRDDQQGRAEQLAGADHEPGPAAPAVALAAVAKLAQDE
jgi:hypothetical protein